MKIVSTGRKRFGKWWFLAGGSFHGLWKYRRYKEIRDLGQRLPQLAWEEQQKVIDAAVRLMIAVGYQCRNTGMYGPLNIEPGKCPCSSCDVGRFLDLHREFVEDAAPAGDKEGG